MPRRRLYYRDYYGRWQEDRSQPRQRRGLPGGRIMWLLLLLAAIMVIASLLSPHVPPARP
jgi:hypothetical protein